MGKTRAVYWVALGAVMAFALGCAFPNLDPVRAGTFTLVHVATPIAKADVNARTAVVATIIVTEGNPRPATVVRIEPLDKSPVK